MIPLDQKSQFGSSFQPILYQHRPHKLDVKQQQTNESKSDFTCSYYLSQ